MSFLTATAPVRVSSSAQAVAPASSSAAAAPASSAQAATTSQAAATTQATSSAAAANSAAAPASSSAPAPAAAAASSSSRASSSAAAASSSVAPSSSAAASSSSTLAPSSSLGSATRSSSASSSSAFFAGSSDSQNLASSSSALPGKTIGAIAGGVVGGIAIFALAFICWRRLKGRRNRVPPPPPRDMSFNPAASATRSRAVSGGMMESGLALGAGGIHRENSYATLLHNNPSAQMSRQPSYYTNYPIATPSTSDSSPPDTSPEFNPVQDSSMIGAAVGAAGDEQARPASRNSRRITSVDRLRMDATAAGSRNAIDRPSSPSSMNFPSPHPAPFPLPEGSAPEGSITPPSPSYPYLSNSRGSSSPMLGPRPGSMSSLSSRGYNYLHVGPARGAPHQGRPIQLEMPRPLSSNPNDLGMPTSSPSTSTGEWGNKRWSGGLGSTNDNLPNPFPQSSPPHQQSRRMPSSQSMGGMTNSQSSRIRTSGTYQPTLGSMSGYEQKH